METIDLSMVYPSGRVATKMAKGFYEKERPLELADIKILYLHAHGSGLLHAKRPIHELEDIRGLRIRSTGFSGKGVEALINRLIIILT